MSRGERSANCACPHPAALLTATWVARSMRLTAPHQRVCWGQRLCHIELPIHNNNLVPQGRSKHHKIAAGMAAQRITAAR